MEYGAHLLGRVPSPPDARDWQLAEFVGLDPLDAALLALQKSRAAKATKAWAAIVTQRLNGATPPGPAPVPPPAPSPQGDVIWGDSQPVLNQANTGHCVGFGWAQWGNTDPVDDAYADSDGHAIYYECKVIDGEPGQENGSNTRSGAKAMQNRGRLSAYAFAQSVDEVHAWVTTKGPVVLGTDWLHDMFSPDPDGMVHVTGAVDGGHEYLTLGFRPELDAFECLNSWSAQWGLHGHFFIKTSDLALLLSRQGEACAALELPL